MKSKDLFQYTKCELYLQLKSGKSFSAILPFQEGQDCIIFKAENFAAGDTVIYISDLAVSCSISPYRNNLDEEEISDAMDCCYTGDDFIELAGGNVEKAERIFNQCSWESPSTILNQLEMYADEEPDADAPITIDMVRCGLLHNTIELVVDPNLESGTVAKIGQYWFYFGGPTAENMRPDEYRKNVPTEDIAEEIFDTLESFRSDANSKDEYDYYSFILAKFEKKISFKNYGMSYTMTPAEIEAAYRYQEHQYHLIDAKQRFMSFYFSCDDKDELEPDVWEAAKEKFREDYGGDPEEVLSNLDCIVAKFEDSFDCNESINSLWQHAISEAIYELFVQ